MEEKQGNYWLALDKVSLDVYDWLYLGFHFVTLKHLEAEILFCYSVSGGFSVPSGEWLSCLIQPKNAIAG